MKDRDVQIGGEYEAKVSGRLARVKVLRKGPHGYECRNLETNRTITCKTAARLRPSLKAKQEAWTEKFWSLCVAFCTYGFQKPFYGVAIGE